MTLAALAGPAIHLANSLVDVGSDERVGRPSLATQLGPSSARKMLAIPTATIVVLAWATLAGTEYEPEIRLLKELVPDIDLSLWPRFAHLANA